MSVTISTPADVHVRPATTSDVDILSHIIHQAYREEGGWTTERHLVSGLRCTDEEILSWLSDPEIVDNEPILIAEYQGSVSLKLKSLVYLVSLTCCSFIIACRMYPAFAWRLLQKLSFTSIHD